MNAVEINDHARKLYASYGPKALAEAAEMVAPVRSERR